MGHTEHAHTHTHKQEARIGNKVVKHKLFLRKKKLIFDGKTFFLGEKMFGLKNLFFPRKKTVLDQKTNFGPGNTQKQIWETIRPNSEKEVFFGFVLEQIGFLTQNHLFPRKTFCFSAQNILFLGKKLVFPPKANLSLGPRKKLGFGRKTNLFLGNRWF